MEGQSRRETESFARGLASPNASRRFCLRPVSGLASGSFSWSGTFPCLKHSGLTPFLELAYRCVGSAGFVIR
jgi:hypothetical protein